ncbi:hypothetical protein [Rubripirellula obstinata]|uniref:hypothetical protein n=1 Tax=Rubripirellula obstinata TaxID=406547 RepID=UPI00122C9807|nr:hypothetical protein [Rubripirellula obstinata]
MNIGSQARDVKDLFVIRSPLETTSLGVGCVQFEQDSSKTERSGVPKSTIRWKDAKGMTRSTGLEE